MSLTLVQLGRALEGLPGLGQFGAGSPDVGRVLDAWQMLRIGGTILRERARMRRALLVEAVLQLLAIELDERLSRRDAIAEIGEHATNDAVDLGRHRDLVLGSQRANHLEVASNRLLANRVRLDGLEGFLRPARLFCARVCTSGCNHRQVQSMTNMRAPIDIRV